MNDKYIKPPTKDEEYVLPPKVNKSNGENYVKPPSRGEKNQKYEGNNENYSRENETKEYVDPYKNPSYFGTPKVGLRFYINSYIIISIFIILKAFSESTSRGIFCLFYFLLTNYTYSWYADYKRYKGEMLWLFQPFGTLKFASAASLFMDNRKASIKRDMFGNLKEKSSRDLSQTFVSFIIILIVTELIKYFINLVVALISVFIHKSTIRKYNKAVDDDMIY